RPLHIRLQRFEVHYKAPLEGSRVSRPVDSASFVLERLCCNVKVGVVPACGQAYRPGFEVRPMLKSVSGAVDPVLRTRTPARDGPYQSATRNDEAAAFESDRLGEPPFALLVALDRTERPAVPFRDPEVEFLHVLVLAQRLGRTVHHHATRF